MCGIAGIYEYRSHRPVERELLAEMLEVIRHRGPDDEGVHLDGDLGIGMRRLSIIDLAGGKQPFYSEDGSVATVFNGEIYNYRELREWLLQRGHRLVSHCDSEVIAHLYEEMGEDCVLPLRGMFAFAVWDSRNRKLLLARDRLGIKPLYYSDELGRITFASEIKALLKHPEVEARPDPRAISHFLSLKYAPAPETFFAGVRSLLPGHTLSCDRSGVRVRRYWDLSFEETDGAERSEEEYAEQLSDLLKECIQSHLMSDVPFGAFLSGGLDSSTIVALMSRFLNEPVKTFSVGFEGRSAGYSELPYARIVARQYATDHHEILIGPNHFTTLAEKVVWHLDQPIADPACLANYMVSTLAAKQVKMVLTGEGGDELFAGYARYAGERFSSVVGQFPRTARLVSRMVTNHVRGSRRVKLALEALAQMDEASRFVHWFCLFSEDAKTALLNKQFAHDSNGAPNLVFAEHLRQTNATDPLARMLYVDTKLWLPDDLLARGDKTSMAASLEARVPLLDHKLVEFAATVPSKYKVHGFVRKYLLKKVSRSWLPPEIVDRKKQGFPMPLSLWFQNEAREFVRDLLAPDTLRRRGILDPASVETLLRQHESGFADHGNQIWALVSLELWCRLFLDSPLRASRPDLTVLSTQGNVGGVAI